MKLKYSDINACDSADSTTEPPSPSPARPFKSLSVSLPPLSSLSPSLMSSVSLDAGSQSELASFAGGSFVRVGENSGDFNSTPSSGFERGRASGEHGGNGI